MAPKKKHIDYAFEMDIKNVQHSFVAQIVQSPPPYRTVWCIDGMMFYDPVAEKCRLLDEKVPEDQALLRAATSRLLCVHWHRVNSKWHGPKANVATVERKLRKKQKGKWY